MEVLILKVGALGDVLRTTSILPGLKRAHPEARVTWVTARGAEDLVRHHPLVERVHAVEAESRASRLELVEQLASVQWTRILALDDDEPVCEMAAELARGRAVGVLSGAYRANDGSYAYTPDTAPWFDMGLISRLGRAEADRLKRANTESHASIFARMLGLEPGAPELPSTPEADAFATSFFARSAPRSGGARIGLNTGAGERWASKRLDVERTVGLLSELERRLLEPSFVLLGGPEESARNAEILARSDVPRVAQPGVEHGLLDFAALISGLDLLVTSDSLALHVAVARRVPSVAFFAPTSAAEIDLRGLGEKVVSLAPDAGSYRSDADTSTLTVERLADAVERTLARPASAG